MKKITAAIICIATVLLCLASCTQSKVDIEVGSDIFISYVYSGTNVTATVTGNAVNTITDNFNGRTIEKEAPKDALYVEGVYFEAEGVKYYFDMNGSSVFMIGDKEGYVDVEQFRLEAVRSVFQPYGIFFTN